MATDMLSQSDLLTALDPRVASIVSRLSDRPELAAVMEQLLNMDGPALARAKRSIAKAKVAAPSSPEIDVDFLRLLRDLPSDVESARLRAREFMDREVEPIANDYWERAEFPYHLIPEFASLDLLASIFPTAPDGTVHHDSVAEGVLTMELARVDCSFATFLGVHGGLAFGSILLCGSKEQQEECCPGCGSGK